MKDKLENNYFKFEIKIITEDKELQSDPVSMSFKKS